MYSYIAYSQLYLKKQRLANFGPTARVHCTPYCYATGNAENVLKECMAIRSQNLGKNIAPQNYRGQKVKATKSTCCIHDIYNYNHSCSELGTCE